MSDFDDLHEVMAERDSLRAKLQAAEAEVARLEAAVVDAHLNGLRESPDETPLRDRIAELEYELQTLLHAYRTGNSVSTIREAQMRKVAGLDGRGE